MIQSWQQLAKTFAEGLVEEEEVIYHYGQKALDNIKEILQQEQYSRHYA